MAPDQTGLALLVLFGTAALKVCGCVCYVGQEPDRATGTGYSWSLAEQRPCECTEFRLGGVNMKPQVKPHEVKIGEDNRVSINEQGQIIRSSDCREDGTSEETSLCAQNILLAKNKLVLQLLMTSPIRLEFKVSTVSYAFVCFSPNGPDCHEALCRVELLPGFARISKRESSSQSWADADYKNGVYIGVPVMVTYDNGRFEMAVQEVGNSTLTYDVPSPPPHGWFVSFYTYDEAELSFTEPCINDFKPQITSQ